MPEVQIFKATYSGVPVYEMMCKGVAVMRRRSDSWLNATQILKVAGFDKPQRTRILEREVQKGEHEKVQGGYGKYQGTWIPLPRGLELASQYSCEPILRPIIDFQPASKSPPLAPKHLVATASASSIKAAAARKAAAANSPAAKVNTRAARRQIPPPGDGMLTETESVDGHGSDGSMTPSPSEASSSSRTPSPINSPGAYQSAMGGANMYDAVDAGPSKRSRQRRYAEPPDSQAGDENEEGDPRTYGDQILEYFISDTNQIPQLLISPPIDFDPNMGIDDDGHTALHWACAMGRVRVVKLLLTAGADIFKVNKSGQTPLMRSVMFANNYDVRKFPELYELLNRTTLNIDNSNRTVFHHIVDVAMSKGKTHAARYYMETILSRLGEYSKELADVINFQDEDGETALTMAARCRSKRLVKLLIDYGADPKIMNNDGKTTEDYILEDERFRSSPAPASRQNIPTPYGTTNGAATGTPFQQHPSWAVASSGYASDRLPPLHHSTAAQKASTKCINDMSSMLDSLASSFDQELREKERDMTQAQALLSNIQAEILDSQRAAAHLRTQAEGMMGIPRVLQERELLLAMRMGQMYRLGWDKWIADEDSREAVIRRAAGGELRILDGSVTASVGNAEQESDKMSVDEPAQEQRTDVPMMNGKREEEQLEDISDLHELYAGLPTDQGAILQACEQLREEISSHHRKRRKLAFDELVKFQGNAGTGARMNDYKRLISAASGVPVTDLDDVLEDLLEALESDESSTSAAWMATGPGRSIPVS